MSLRNEGIAPDGRVLLEQEEEAAIPSPGLGGLPSSLSWLLVTVRVVHCHLGSFCPALMASFGTARALAFRDRCLFPLCVVHDFCSHFRRIEYLTWLIGFGTCVYVSVKGFQP
eukprot:PhF_6_TR19910/c0_g1_i1/m.28955